RGRERRCERGPATGSPDAAGGGRRGRGVPDDRFLRVLTAGSGGARYGGEGPGGGGEARLPRPASWRPVAAPGPGRQPRRGPRRAPDLRLRRPAGGPVPGRGGG